MFVKVLKIDNIVNVDWKFLFLYFSFAIIESTHALEKDFQLKGEKEESSSGTSAAESIVWIHDHFYNQELMLAPFSVSLLSICAHRVFELDKVHALYVE